MSSDPQRALLSAFNFRVALNRSGGGAGGGAGAGASVGAGAGVSFSASASASASASGGLSAGASASFGASIDIGATMGSSSSQLGDGGFQECTGLEINMDVHEITEGGRNNGTVRLVGHGKYANITLKRGMLFPVGGTAVNEIWSWLQGILSGQRPVVRYDGVIEVLSASSGAVTATWVFDRGLPAKVSGPSLSASSGAIAIEELSIAHEGLRLRI
ncbi:MAG: phage tail protein [Gemmatimonadota bacterium]|nr:phage tail protein [Gemmatimonadota bacterium]